MKPELSQLKLEANRRNSKLGGEAFSRIAAERYAANPMRCKHCDGIIPQDKKRNKFCSMSCSAVYNNTGREKVKRYSCAHCGIESLTSGKFCSIICSADYRRKYKTADELAAATRMKQREVSANYRAKVKAQTPDDVDRVAIREFYDACPVGYEVDHIIPISKNGLHTLSNLQYLTINENRKKSNKL